MSSLSSRMEVLSKKGPTKSFRLLAGYTPTSMRYSIKTKLYRRIARGGNKGARHEYPDKNFKNSFGLHARYHFDGARWKGYGDRGELWVAYRNHFIRGKHRDLLTAAREIDGEFVDCPGGCVRSPGPHDKE